MASIPSMRTRQATLQQIDGAMPRLNAIPEGCAFNPRCARASAQRRAERPVLEVRSHAIACWNPFEGEAHV